MHTSNAIAKLIESCLDEQRTLLDESRVVDAPRRKVLSRIADERGDFVQELAKLGPARLKGSWREPVRELGRHLWERAAGRNVSDSISACKVAEDRSIVEYKKALELEWPEDVRAILTRQYQRIRTERDELAKIEYES